MSQRTFFLLFALSIAGSVFADGFLPVCSSVSGIPAVTFTRDDGATLAPTKRVLKGIAYTNGLAVVKKSDALLAAHDSKILVSFDAGCHWSVVDHVPAPILNLTPSGRRTYGWVPNGNQLFDIFPLGGATPDFPPVTSILGLGVDPKRENHLRIGDGAGVIWDSRDAGSTWTIVGRLVINDPILIIYHVAFDPQNLDHIVIGTANHGAFVSRNGGARWKQSTGGFSHEHTNFFSVAISPSRSRIVWAMGLDIKQLDRGARSQGRHIYRSDDDGFTFEPVISQSKNVTLINGPLLAVHPTDPNILYFVFGTFFQNYGTDLFRYNFRTRTLTKTHNGHDGISSIVFSPDDPQLLYLGLTSEQGIQ